MPKKLINFTERQIAALTAEADALQISFTELVRRIIDQHTWMAARPQRKKAAKVAVMMLAFGLLAGCGSSPLAPTAAATLEARAIALTCDAETCRFTGTAANTGNECARGVNGLLAIRNPDGSLFVQVSWNLPDEQVIRPTQQFTYSGQIPQRTYPTGATTQTFFYWREVRCP